MYSSAPAKFQAFLSQYTINSLLWAVIEKESAKQEIGGWLTNDDIPESTPIQLTTSGLNLFFNNLDRDYGPDHPIDIKYSLVRLGNVTIEERDEEISALADLKLELWVVPENGTRVKDLEFYIRDLGATTSVKFDEETNEIYARINMLTMGNVEVVGDSTANANTISQVMSFVLDSMRIPLNNMVQDYKFKVPTSFSVFELSDLDLTYHQGYIEAGLTPSFTAPKEEFVPRVPDAVNSDDFVFMEILSMDNYETSSLSDKSIWAQTA